MHYFSALFHERWIAFAFALVIVAGILTIGRRRLR